jgi:hypothetical protein
MKKILYLFMALCMIFALCACTSPAMSNPDGSDTVAGAAVKTGLDVLEAALVTLLSVAGAALIAKMKQRTELQNISIATEHVIDIAKQTVGELKQTVVDGMKAASEDGKLTPDQIAELNQKLLELTLSKLDEPTKNLIAAVGMDLCALITGAAEDWIGKGKITELLPAGIFGEVVHVEEKTGNTEDAEAEAPGPIFGGAEPDEE